MNNPAQNATPAARPPYEKPKVTDLSEKDVLRTFQVTGAAATWWGM
jgi:hypothetical protein